MITNPVRCEYFNSRHAVEQRGLLFIVDGQSELTVCSRIVVCSANHPPTIELVVRVDDELISKVNQHCFAARFDFFHMLAFQPRKSS
jgi:hypothetical protein